MQKAVYVYYMFEKEIVWGNIDQTVDSCCF